MTDVEPAFVLEAHHLTKRFPGVVTNDPNDGFMANGSRWTESVLM